MQIYIKYIANESSSLTQISEASLTYLSTNKITSIKHSVHQMGDSPGLTWPMARDDDQYFPTIHQRITKKKKQS